MDNERLHSINLDCWDRLIKNVINLRHGVNCCGPNIDKILSDLKKMASNPWYEFTDDDIIDKHYSSALLNLWATDAEFSKNVPIQPILLEKVIYLNGNSVSTLMLYSFIDIYFFQYDNLKENAGFLITKIIGALNEKIKKASLSGLDFVYQNKEMLFDSKFKTHEIIVSNAIDNRVSLSNELAKYNLVQSDFGRFYEKCRNFYYIKRIEDATLDTCYSILEEVLKEKIHLKDYENGRNVGHKIIHLLLSKLEKHVFSIKKYQHIINFILQVAGDPRIRMSDQHYQNWWMVLGEQDIAIMKKCLSGFDLELFLEIYGEFADKNNNKVQCRMFNERKKFLQGMMLNDLIHETKLFIGKNMVEYLRKKYNLRKLPAYYTIKDSPSMAVIYMRYNNTLFTEGCFNCKFRAYEQIIPNSPFYSKKKEYSYRDLGEGYFGKHDSYERFEKVHGGNWQTAIINYFEQVSGKHFRSKIFFDGFESYKI